MDHRSSFALASMTVALFAANTQAALEAHWSLDENPITPDVATAADATGNWDGVYKDASFFGEGDPISVTGHTGLPNTAVRFGKNKFVVIETPRDSNDPTHFGGITAPLGEFMIEYWFQLHPGGSVEFSECIPAGGPVLILGGGTTSVQFRALRWTDSVVDITPPDGLDIDQWYYIAGPYVPPRASPI